MLDLVKNLQDNPAKKPKFSVLRFEIVVIDTLRIFLFGQNNTAAKYLVISPLQNANFKIGST